MKILIVGTAEAATKLASALKTGLGNSATVNTTIPDNFKPKRPPKVDVVIFADGSKGTLGAASKMIPGITVYIHIESETQLPNDFNRGPFGGFFFADTGGTATLINELAGLAAIA